MKQLAYFLLAIAFCLMLAASSVSAKETITIKDDLGRDVTISSPSERVVFTMENALKTYYAVGDSKNVAALKDDKWMRKLTEDIFPVVDPEFEKKIVVNITGDQLNLESLAKVNPDLVVLWASSPEDPNLLAINDTLKVPTFAIYVTSLDDVFSQVDTMGMISGNKERAAEVKEIMNSYVTKTTNVTDKLTESDKPKVFWMWTDVYGTAGVKSGMNDLIEEAGGVNVMTLAEKDAQEMEHPVVTQETLIKLNPDVIYMWYNENLDPKDILNGDEFKGWKDINAVKNKRVYEIGNPSIFDAFSPRMPLALLHVAKDLHPDKFPGLDMNQTVDQYNVDMWGVHYPSMAKA
jgi:iron complex transport system substrate-binding protein